MVVMKKLGWIISIIILLVLLFLWAPWITEDYAESRLLEKWDSRHDSSMGITDQPGRNCDTCGIIENKRGIFGRILTLRTANSFPAMGYNEIKYRVIFFGKVTLP